MGIIRLLLKAFLGGSKKKSSKRNRNKKSTQGARSITIGQLQDSPIPDWMGDDVTGLEFCATLQLRTPLRVLLRNGERYLKKDGRQPKIAHEQWEGAWVPVIKTWKELGIIGISEFPELTIASDVGPVMSADYLPFLINVRKIVESNDSVDSRIKMLREYSMYGDWKTYVEKHGGIEKIINRFFPRFLDTIPKLNDTTIAELSNLDLDTPNLLASATDETLLGIKGIGQSKIKTVRDYCASIIDYRDNVRCENVKK